MIHLWEDMISGLVLNPIMGDCIVETALMLKGEKLSDTVICPFVRMVQKKCSVVDAEILHLMLWKIYMVSARKEAFVADDKKELHPLFDQER